MFRNHGRTREKRLRRRTARNFRNHETHETHGNVGVHIAPTPPWKRWQGHTHGALYPNCFRKKVLRRRKGGSAAGLQRRASLLSLVSQCCALGRIFPCALRARAHEIPSRASLMSLLSLNLRASRKSHPHSLSALAHLSGRWVTCHLQARRQACTARVKRSETLPYRLTTRSLHSPATPAHLARQRKSPKSERSVTPGNQGTR